MHEDPQDEYFTHELPLPARNLRMRKRRRQNCLAWILALAILALIVGTAIALYFILQVRP